MAAKTSVKKSATATKKTSSQKTVHATASAPAKQTAVKDSDKRATWTHIGVSFLACLLLLVASLGIWAKNNFFNSQQFSNHVVAAVQEQDVRNAIGSSVSSKLYDGKPVLGRVLGQPTENLVSSLLVNDRFSSVLYNISDRLNERLFHGKTNDVVIDISGFSAGIKSLAATLRPDAEVNLPEGEDARIVLINGSAIPNLQKTAQVVLFITPVALLSLLILATISWLRIRRKSVFFKYAGIVAIATGVVLAIVTQTASAQLSLLAKNANQAVILGAVYDEFVASLQTYQTWLIVGGITTLVVRVIILRRAQIADWSQNAGKKLKRAE